MQAVTKAMILAAGLGTRLRPLTNDRPKALVTINGRTLLEIVIARLRAAGVRKIIVNTHHFADRIRDYLADNRNFGMRIELSYEDTLLDTGGGLKKAAWFFLEGKDPGDAALAPFILHNVDVISTIDLARMALFHRQRGALATLAEQSRESSRYLLFDEHGHLCGRRIGRDTAPQLVRPALSAQALAFCGVHVISPQIFAKLSETGAFSIIDAYLRLAAQGERILSFRADGAYWRDLGRPRSVAEAAREPIAEHDES
jgi:NDP-sugar pyrophosphorylase family protein